MEDGQNHARHFVYVYFNRSDPGKIREVVPAHVGYWQTANPQGYLGGPFADRQGGLITFVASSLEEATKIISQDPFLVEDLIEQKWIKEWDCEQVGIDAENDTVR